MDNRILNSLPNPVIVLDDKRVVVDANKAADSLLQGNYMGEDLAFSLRHPDILGAVDAVIAGEKPNMKHVLFTHPILRSYDMYLSRVEESDQTLGQKDGRVVLVLHDTTASYNADKFRTDFVANVSHELRSPLVSLLGFIETLQETARDDSEARDRFLTIMAKEANRMNSLVDDLLSLSKIEANEHIRPEGQVDIENILSMVLEPLTHKANRRDMTLSLNIQSAIREIPGDADELIQVFSNLIDNAIKYGREETDISIDVERTDRIPDLGVPGISVSITNQGEGISPEHIPRLTERFYRIDTGRSRSMGGTGLGLAIVKHMINHHRGRLLIRSKVGESSTFTVFLPETL